MKMQLMRNLVLGCATLFSTMGCQPSTEPSAPSSSLTSDHGHDHGQGNDHNHAGHGAGPHEGTLADWGGGKFHVEFTVDHDKKLATVFILGSDEKSPAPIHTDKILLSIKQPPFQLELMAQPFDGERDGLSSKFMGEHDNLGIIQEFSGTISGEVDGTPYAGNFTEVAHTGHDSK
jgi:hypothetical protein